MTKYNNFLHLEIMNHYIILWLGLFCFFEKLIKND